MTRAAREVNPEALALYLQAARAGDPRRHMTYLEQAILRDSTFALAYAKLAIAYVMIARDGVRAERAVATALALEPTLSDGYDALGLLRMWVDRDWRAAETAFRRALELNPHNGLAHHELGQLHMRLGRCDDAVVEEGRAVLQHPGVVHYQNGLAEIHLYCRRYDDAVREFRKALELVRDSAGTYVSLGDAYFHQRQYGAALAMYEQSRRPVPGWVLIALGRTREARSRVDSLQAQWARGEGNAFTAWNLARIYTTLGERERAITWLERGHEAGHGLVIYLGVHPHFDALRGEPRFRSLLRRVHLAD
jgi:serine/threonine-protein kinase